MILPVYTFISSIPDWELASRVQCYRQGWTELCGIPLHHNRPYGGWQLGFHWSAQRRR